MKNDTLNICCEPSSAPLKRTWRRWTKFFLSQKVQHI